MNVKTVVQPDGRFKVTAEQGEVTCISTMPTSAEALSTAIKSCYQVIDILEGLRDTAHCPSCDEG